jgi:signal transduction histidine kinase
MKQTSSETASADLMVGGGIVHDFAVCQATRAPAADADGIAVTAPKKMTWLRGLSAQIDVQSGRGGPRDANASDDDVRSGRRMTTSRRFVNIAFMLIGVGVLAITLFAVVQTRRLQSGARLIVDNMLTSVRLLGNLKSEVQKRRILIDDHIFTKDPKEMSSLEGQIAAVEADIDATTVAYDPWADQPGERATWDRTRADLAILRTPIARALTLSRANRDPEARQVMDQVATAFALVGQDFDQLIVINDRSANTGLTEFSMIRFRLMVTLLALGLGGLLGTALLGRWASRQVAQREAEIMGHAQALEARNRELDAFAGRVAHDVRGPLTTIKLAMTPLEAKLPEGDRTLDLLGRGVGRMEGLVEDLLALARIEAQVRGRCDPARVVAEIEGEFAPRIEAEKGALRVSVDHAEVSCNEGLLRQAVANLVENAVKYHRPEVAPEVSISGTAIDGGYDLRVSDNGLGMSNEEASHAFEPFYRSPRTQDRPGTGLGLSIVNRVAEASGGTLSVQSRLGQGSTFVVHLPLAGGAMGDSGHGA